MTAGLEYALDRLHAGETRLHASLLRVADRHRAEHELHHVARDLAAWSAEHVGLLADAAAEHGLQLDPALDDEADEPSGPVQQLRSGLAQLAGRSPAPGVLVLEDLRELHLQAADNSLRWEMLAQLAQAARYADLVTLCGRCHPQNLRQLRWTNTMIKIQSPQILTSL